MEKTDKQIYENKIKELEEENVKISHKLNEYKRKLEKKYDIDTLLTRHKKIQIKWNDHVSMFTNKDLVLFLSKSQMASIIGDFLRTKEQLENAITLIQNIKNNINSIKLEEQNGKRQR